MNLGTVYKVINVGCLTIIGCGVVFAAHAYWGPVPCIIEKNGDVHFGNAGRSAMYLHGAELISDGDSSNVATLPSYHVYSRNMMLKEYIGTVNPKNVTVIKVSVSPYPKGSIFNWIFQKDETVRF